MRIRTKSILAATVLLTGTLSALGYGVVLAVSAIQREDLEASARVIENSAQRVALDALLQKDELELVSYVNFLKAQYPALTYAKIVWNYPPLHQEVNLGESTNIAPLEERRLDVQSPVSPKNKVILRFYIDHAVLQNSLTRSRLKLEMVTLKVWLFALTIGIILAWILALAFTTPLKSLATLATAVGSGSLGKKLEWRSEDEIGELVQAFNNMSDRLKELDSMKKNFISSVTHELRSPLGAMISLTNLVEDKLKLETSTVARQSLDYLDRINKNAQRLESFVSQLLDAAKIEQGKFECELRPFQIEEAITDICRLFDPKAREKKIQIINEIKPDLPLVSADPERIRQVFSNLISNALKFAPEEGQIRISSERFRENNLHWIEFSISDTGQGMDQADLELLFKAFSQGRNASQEMGGHERGTGLGLYIVKSIVEAHGGKVSVRSNPGHGTVFTFTLKEAKQDQGGNDNVE